MRIAISTDGLNVASHFGRCPEYTIVDIEDGKVKSRPLMLRFDNLIERR